MKINWTVRLKNPAFWLTAIPAVLILVGQVLELFGIHWDLTPVGQQISAITGTVFSVLALLGVVVDPTTAKLSDSPQAMTYQEPKKP